MNKDNIEEINKEKIELLKKLKELEIEEYKIKESPLFGIIKCKCCGDKFEYKYNENHVNLEKTYDLNDFSTIETNDEFDFSYTKYYCKKCRDEMAKDFCKFWHDDIGFNTEDLEFNLEYLAERCGVTIKK